MQKIQGKPKEGAVVLIFLVVPLLLATPWALPNVYVAWYFSWTLAAIFSFWGICLCTRSSEYLSDKKVFVRKWGPAGLFETTHPISDFVALRHIVRDEEGTCYSEIEVQGENRLSSFLFATGVGFESLEKAKSDPVIQKLLGKLSIATGLPVTQHIK